MSARGGGGKPELFLICFSVSCQFALKEVPAVPVCCVWFSFACSLACFAVPGADSGTSCHSFGTRSVRLRCTLFLVCPALCPHAM